MRHRWASDKTQPRQELDGCPISRVRPCFLRLKDTVLAVAIVASSRCDFYSVNVIAVDIVLEHLHRPVVHQVQPEASHSLGQQ